jgi:hypothetical protein
LAFGIISRNCLKFRNLELDKPRKKVFVACWKVLSRPILNGTYEERNAYHNRVKKSLSYITTQCEILLTITNSCKMNMLCHISLKTRQLLSH